VNYPFKNLQVNIDSGLMEPEVQKSLLVFGLMPAELYSRQTI